MVAAVTIVVPVRDRAALLDRSDVFVRTMAEKLLTYGTGRALKYYDMPAVRRIVRDAGTRDFKFSALIAGVVKSTPFQMKVKAPPLSADARQQ